MKQNYFINVRNDESLYHNILLHVPHSSIAFPDASKVCFDDLDDEERLLIDYYTDELFIPSQNSNSIDSVVFPYCRLYCDVERLINDPLEKVFPIQDGLIRIAMSASFAHLVQLLLPSNSMQTSILKSL